MLNPCPSVYIDRKILHLGSFVVRFSLLMTSFQSVFWSSLYFLFTLLFARYSPFNLCLLLFSFAFLSPYSAYFSVLSNFLARFPRLALHLLLLNFFGGSASFFLAYFHSKSYLHNLELQHFPQVEKFKLRRYCCFTS